MGKLLQPMHSVKVSCEKMDIPEAKTAPATSIPVEYLEDYDYFGAESATVASAKNSSDEKTSPTGRTPGGSSQFARVLRRQSSVTASQLRTFGEEITPSHQHED